MLLEFSTRHTRTLPIVEFAAWASSVPDAADETSCVATRQIMATLAIKLNGNVRHVRPLADFMSPPFSPGKSAVIGDIIRVTPTWTGILQSS